MEIQSLAQILLDSHNKGTTLEGACINNMLQTLIIISKDPLVNEYFPRLNEQLTQKVFRTHEDELPKITARGVYTGWMGLR